jgi:hypothetical protein
MREAGLLEGALATISSLLILIGLVGLVLITRQRGRLTRTARAGVTLGVAGVAVLVAAGVMNEAVFDGNFAQMPYAVLPGMAALIAGFALVGAAVLRARVLPRWIGAGLVLGALAMVGANEQTAQVLLMVPFGVAWVIAGRSLLRRN